MQRAIVTGASGFIGSKLTEFLLRKGYKVTAVVREPSKLEDIASRDLSVVCAQLCEYSRLEDMIPPEDYAVFFHLAWEGTFGESFRDYSLQMRNAVYAGDALSAANRIGCRRFVLMGSLVQIETSGYIGRDEDNLRVSCIYGAAKNAAETICKVLANQNGIILNTAVLASVYGEGDRSNMIQNVLIRHLLQGKAPKLVSGDNLYDWIYIDDVINALYSISLSGIPNRTYYVGHTELQSFEELVTRARNVINPNVELRFGEMTDKTVIDYALVDRTALFRDTGFLCRADFDASIRRTAAWLKEKENL